MGVVEHELPGEGFGAKLVAEETDGWVVVTMGGFVFGRWSSGHARQLTEVERGRLVKNLMNMDFALPLARERPLPISNLQEA